VTQKHERAGALLRDVQVDAVSFDTPVMDRSRQERRQRVSTLRQSLADHACKACAE